MKYEAENAIYFKLPAGITKPLRSGTTVQQFS